MTDKFLRFESQEQAEDVLFDKTEDGQLITKGCFVADVIGIIHRTIVSKDGKQSETLESEGWHVNVRGPDAGMFSEYEVDVNMPVRFWA